MVNKGNNAGIILPNPNAPTGCLLSIDEIKVLLNKNTQSVIVIDEAYIDFGGDTAISLINDYPNLLVTQTLSKSRSLAGMRIGFAIGNVDLIEALTRVKDSFNSYPMDSLAIAAGIEAFNDQTYFEQICQQVINSREWVVKELEELGFSILPSSANFIFATHSDYNAGDLAAGLRQHGIIVRHFKAERVQNFLRITIGTQEENQQFLSVFETLL